MGDIKDMEIEALAAACHSELWRAEPWLKSRGVSLEEATRWGMGFDHIGLSSKTAGRVTIPVWHPYSGFLVALTSRATRSDMEPKWMHTSPFQCNRMLFGKVRRRRLPYLALVEGPLDVVALERIGVHAVAAFGSGALTGWQVGLILRWTDFVIIYADDDGTPPDDRGRGGSGGAAARHHWTNRLTNAGVRIAIGPYCGGARDPDELVQYDPDYVVEYIQSIL